MVFIAIFIRGVEA